MTLYFQLHSVVKAALESDKSSSYRVFYLLNDDPDESNSFAAIVGLVEEKILSVSLLMPSNCMPFKKYIF